MALPDTGLPSSWHDKSFHSKSAVLNDGWNQIIHVGLFIGILSIITGEYDLLKRNTYFKVVQFQHISLLYKNLNVLHSNISKLSS